MATDLLAELIADAQQIVLQRRPRVVQLPNSPRPPANEIRIPESTVSLVEGYAEYGA